MTYPSIESRAAEIMDERRAAIAQAVKGGEQCPAASKKGIGWGVRHG